MSFCPVLGMILEENEGISYAFLRQPWETLYKKQEMEMGHSFQFDVLAQANKTLFGCLEQIFSLGQVDLLTSLFTTLNDPPASTINKTHPAISMRSLSKEVSWKALYVRCMWGIQGVLLTNHVPTGFLIHSHIPAFPLWKGDMQQHILLHTVLRATAGCLSRP